MTKEILEKLVNQKLSANKIAEILNKGSSTIRYYLKKYGLKTKWKIESKYSDNEILELANNSLNFSDFLKKINSKNSGGAHYHYRQRLKKLNFNFSKFHNNSGGKITAIKRNQEALKRKKRATRGSLVFLLKQNGVEYQCFECKISEWRNKKILLQIHHKNHNRYDNSIENLCYLCPNCHSIKHYNENGKLRDLRLNSSKVERQVEALCDASASLA